MQKIIIDCESALKKLNRQHLREKHFLSKFLSIFTNAHIITLKPTKERDPNFETHPFSWLLIADKTLTQPCCLLHSTSEITAIDVGAFDSHHKHTGYIHAAAASLWPGNILVLVTCMPAADGAPATPDYNTQRHHEEWHGQALLAQVVCNIIWLHASDRKHFQNWYLIGISLLVGRTIWYSRMWCFMSWIDLFHCLQEATWLLSKR